MQAEIVEHSEFTSYQSLAGSERIRLKNILVPTDFSEVSVKALHYGVALARQFNATLWLLHVVPAIPTYTYAGMETGPIVLDNAQVRADAEQRMAEFAKRHAPSGVAVTALVRQGAAEKEIPKFAAAQEIDLLIASTHERTGLNRIFSGGITEKIAHHSPCPLLIVRDPEHEFLDASVADGARAIRIQRILAPVDFSDCSKKALRYTMAFASQFGAEVFCLHVKETEKPKIIFETESYAKEWAAEAENNLSALMREVDGRVHVERKMATGVPHREIMALADEREVDLIVVGEHCKTGGFGRFMMGSTTDEVVRHAHCPVLVVRPNEHEFVG